MTNVTVINRFLFHINIPFARSLKLNGKGFISRDKPIDLVRFFFFYTCLIQAQILSKILNTNKFKGKQLLLYLIFQNNFKWLTIFDNPCHLCFTIALYLQILTTYNNILQKKLSNFSLSSICKILDILKKILDYYSLKDIVS